MKTLENKGFVGQSLINKKGFTLIELLAVIVILGVISLIAVPIILGIISDAKEAGFKESLNNTFHAYELYEAENGFNEITDKVSVTDKSFPLKSNFKTGVVYRNAEKVIEVDYISDGTYCAAGTKNKLSMVKGKCDILDKTEAQVDVKVNKITTNSITVIVVANDPESGIEGIYYKIGDSEYKKGTERNTFDNLEENKEYTISVKVINGNKVETVSELKVTTQEFEEATYSIDNEDWASEKIVTINYPEGENLTYEYSIDKGHTWITATNPQEVTFTSNGTLMTKVIYGTNEKEFSTLSVDKIDTTKPTIESIEGNTEEWSRNKTLKVNASDTESGVLEYSFDNGVSWQSSNSKTVTENKTYQIKVRDNAGNISEVTEVIVSKIDTTSPIVTLGSNEAFARTNKTATFTGINTTSKTNVSCNNGAIPSVSGTTLTVTNVTSDTTCSLNTTLGSAVNNADTSKNNIVMLSNETIDNKIIINDNKNIKLNLNGKMINFENLKRPMSNRGILVIDDTAGNGELKNISNSKEVIYNANNLTINNGILRTLGDPDDDYEEASNFVISNTGNLLINNAFIYGNYGIQSYNKLTINKIYVETEIQGINIGSKSSISDINNAEVISSISIYNFGNTTLKNINISGEGRAIYNTGGTINIYSSTMNKTNDLMQSRNSGTINIYSGIYTSETGNVINNTSGTVNIKGGTFDAKANNTVNNSSTGIINISGGKFLSSATVIYNTSSNDITITDTDNKVYIYTNSAGSDNVYYMKSIINVNSGNIKIKGSVADKCGEEENTTGICVYNKIGRAVLNESEATGNIYINGAYIVGGLQAVNNYIGNTYICNAKLNGGTYDINNSSTGYTYYKDNVILENNSIRDASTNSPSHLILDNSFTCN